MNENTNTVNSLTDTAIDTAIRLSDTAISTALPKDKPYKLQDGLGMHVKVMPNGSKYFRLDYRLNGKRQTLALGVYPETSLEQAREARDSARKQIKNGIKPKIKDKQPNNEAPKSWSLGEQQVENNYQKAVIGPLAYLRGSGENTQTQDGISTKADTVNKTVHDKTDTVKELKLQLQLQLQQETRKNDELQGKVAAMMAFSNLTKEQRAMLSNPDHLAAIIKLKELDALRVNTRISDKADDELIDELKRRGYSVTQICNETV